MSEEWDDEIEKNLDFLRLQAIGLDNELIVLSSAIRVLRDRLDEYRRKEHAGKEGEIHGERGPSGGSHSGLGAKEGHVA